MNIVTLEKMARKALRGEDIDVAMKRAGLAVSPAEHRSLQSLSWQIASNLQAKDAGTLALREPMKLWI
jgi:hypothetical protein